MKASIPAFTQEEETLEAHFFNREIKDHTPGDIAKEITQQVPVCSLITERCFAGRKFFAGCGVEGDADRHYSKIRVAKRAELRGTTRLGDRGETEIEKRSVTIMVVGEMGGEVNHLCEGLSN